MDMTLDFVELELENIVVSTSSTQVLIDEMICKAQEDGNTPGYSMVHHIVLIYTQALFVVLSGNHKVAEHSRERHLLKVVSILLNMDILTVQQDTIEVLT